jgi:murein DD-endopeptidase MepM/ murein hydrolase activator NlpD
MFAKAYLARHGGHVFGVVIAGVLAAGAAIGAAKADIAPVEPAHPTLAQSIMGGVGRIASAPLPAPQLQPLAFEAPLPGYSVNSPFGPRALNGEDRNGKIHEGVDIAAPKGTLIHATMAGQIVRTGLSQSYGNFVEVMHLDGISSFYAHMSRTAGLKVGDPVKSGDVLGYVGSTGHSTGPHLHFEIRKDGEHFDPSLFMGHVFQTAAALPLTVAAFGQRAWRPMVVRAGYHTSRVRHSYGR